MKKIIGIIIVLLGLFVGLSFAEYCSYNAQGNYHCTYDDGHYEYRNTNGSHYDSRTEQINWNNDSINNTNIVSDYEEVYLEQQKQKEDGYQEYIDQQYKEYLLDNMDESISCPAYSYLYNSNCYCYNGYVWNKLGTACISNTSKAETKKIIPVDNTKDNDSFNNIKEDDKTRNECSLKNGIGSIPGSNGCVCKEGYTLYSENDKLSCKPIQYKDNKIGYVIKNTIKDTIKDVLKFDDIWDYLICVVMIYSLIGIRQSLFKK